VKLIKATQFRTRYFESGSEPDPAEAVEYEIISLCGDLRKSGYSGISVKELLHESVSRSSRIRNEAKKFDDQ